MHTYAGAPPWLRVTEWAVSPPPLPMPVCLRGVCGVSVSLCLARSQHRVSCRSAVQRQGA